MGVFFKSFPLNLFFLRLLPGRRDAAFFIAGGFGRLFRRLAMSSPIKSQSSFKCLHCKEKHPCDPRNRGRQHYCRKPECRRASKAASQRKWLGRAENKNYFRGPDNCERMRRWREAHPGYWRRKKSAGEDALQEPCKSQVIEGKELALHGQGFALQEAWFAQPALLVGLIAVVTGNALQEDIAASARRFLDRGRDILGIVPQIRSPQLKSPACRHAQALQRPPGEPHRDLNAHSGGGPG